MRKDVFIFCIARVEHKTDALIKSSTSMTGEKIFSSIYVPSDDRTIKVPACSYKREFMFGVCKFGWWRPLGYIFCAINIAGYMGHLDVVEQ